ncbi:MAG: chemotaxis protein CheW [Nitrospinae bacterium]|nr:chemotaxis protein CheW [Nitrospinota bacterium]
MASPGVLAAFFSESDTHFEVIEHSLLELEKSPANMDIINELFRAVHSLKGNAGLVGLLDVHAIATEVETMLDQIRTAKQAVTQAQRDHLFESLDKVKGMVDKSRGGDPKAGEHHEEHHEEHPAKSEEEHEAGHEEAKADKAGDAPQRKAVHGKRSFLTFALNSEEYGFSITSVREIIIRRHITRVPNAKHYLVGIMNLRGMVIPVLDAKKKLGFASADGGGENVIIIENEGAITGVLVDQVRDILSLEENMIVAGDQALGNMRSGYIEGIGKAEKKTVMLLDIKTFCDVKEKYF